MIFVKCLLAAILLLAVAPNFMQEGRRKYAANEFAEAAVQFQRAVQANPADSEARLWLGYSFLELDDLESALQNLAPLLQRMSSDPEYVYALSEAYTRGARRLSERITELGDGSARAHELLAYRYKALGQPRNALPELRQAAKSGPTLAGIHIETAEIFWQAQQYDEAAAELQAELRIAPNDFLANLRYGQYLLHAGDYQDAIAPLSIAAGYRKYPEAFELAAYAWGKLGKPEDQIAALRAGTRAFPVDASLTEMLHQCVAANPGDPNRIWTPHQFQEKPPPDVARLRATLARDPRDEEALFSLSRIYSERGEDLFEQLERVAPGSYRVKQLKGLNAEYAEDFEKAESYYNQVVVAQPQSAGAHYALGHVLRKLGKEDEGLWQIERELEIDPRNYLASYELGSGRLGHGDPVGAVPLLERAIASHPDFSQAETDLAKAFLQLKHPEKAEDLLLGVIARHPNNPTAHFLLFRAYTFLGSVDLAKRELKIHQELLKASAPLSLEQR